MKSIVFAGFLFFTCIGLYGQDVEVFQLGEKEPEKKQVTQMAVFPGCENILATEINKQRNCLSRKITDLLSHHLSYFADRMETVGWTSANARIRFVISVKGKIIKVEPVPGGNPELTEAALKAMGKIVSKLKFIQPAKIEDGTQVNLVFELPIQYTVQNPQTVDYKWDEIVRVTLKAPDKKIEIRVPSSQRDVFKLYEIKGNKEIFVKEYKSLDQLKTDNEYEKLHSFNGKILMAEKQIRKDLFRIYYSDESPDALEVYKVVNGTEQLFEKLNSNQLQYSKLYLNLILR